MKDTHCADCYKHGVRSSASLITHHEFMPSLTGWRGVLALCILIYHFNPFFLPLRFTAGYLGVDFFFVISGFILARLYEESVASRRMRFSELAARRLIRLYPVYFITTLLVAALAIYWTRYGHHPIISAVSLYRDVALQLLLLQNVGGMYQPWNSPAWTVSVEWVVNMLFFAALWRFGRIGSVWLLAMIALSVAVMLSVSPYAIDIASGHFGRMHATLARGMAGFLIGVLLFRWHTKLPALRPALLHAAELSVAAAALLLLNFHSQIKGIDYLFLLLIIPAALLLSLYAEGWFTRLLSLPPCLLLGRISYAVYLMHFPAYLVFVMWVSAPLGELPAPYSGLLYLGLTLYMALLVHYGVEKPGRALGRRLMAKNATV